MIRIDSSADSFTEFYTDFYHQLKCPEEYSFFKVTEFEVLETAIGLQKYVDCSSSIEVEDLRHYEVSIDTVDVLKNKEQLKVDSSDGTSSCSKKSSAEEINPKYRYQIEDVDWNAMAEMGLTKETLEELGALDFLLKGYKTPMLIPVLINDGEVVSDVNARLQLKINDVGELVVRVHQVLKKVDFRKKFRGHRFTKEDRNNLLSSGNMGRIVDLVHPVTGEKIPSLVSLDKLTNKLISLRTEFVRIPAVLCGVTLNMEQKQMLREGKAVFVENMVSKRNKLFSVKVQFNTDRQWVEFLFERNLRSAGFNALLDSSERGVPSTFRGMKLRRWQIDKLKAGETAYIKGLESKNGKTYQGYMSFDATIGRIVFSFKNPKK
ncbi:DUF3945 domain-containing protein [Chryseobacterium sp. M5]|uniref:DUF3945 domain-containing protein n=1 Tax=Chryseobacterium sp. M5 TaxID=3379128 RepID=UPI003857B230